MLKPLLKKIEATRDKIQRGANFDKINLADDVRERSPLVKSIVDRTARIFYEGVLGMGITPLPQDFDTNQKASLSVQEFVFESVAENPAANLLTMEIIADSDESVEVIDRHIKVYIDDGVSDHDSIKALIDADDEASSLITVAINAGEGATVVVAEDVEEFSGAIG